MKTLRSIAIYTCLLLAVSTAAYAQPGFTNDVEDAPLDGGVSALAAAAIGYGVKKLKDNKKKAHEQKAK